MEIMTNQRNKQHLQQAGGIPFTTEPLKTILGEDERTEDCNKILMGTFYGSNLHLTNLQKQYLKALKGHSGTLESPLRNEITTSDINKDFPHGKKEHPGRHLIDTWATIKLY